MFPRQPESRPTFVSDAPFPQPHVKGGYDDIVPAVLRLDPKLTADRLQVILEICPVVAEEKRLLGFRGKDGELIEGERWMLSIARLQVHSSETWGSACCMGATLYPKCLPTNRPSHPSQPSFPAILPNQSS